MTFDVNCGANFPFDQEVRADYDVVLPRGAGDEEYLLALNTELTRCLDAEKPDFVFYDAGVDVLADDDLGHLELSTAGLRKRGEEEMVRGSDKFFVPVSLTLSDPIY